MNKFAAGFSALACLLYAVPSHAQLSRTWVSGVGNDLDACSRTAPCKTFQGAFNKTLAGGEISVLDPGGFGTLNITKSISITNDNSGEAGVLAIATNGFIVNGSGIVVQLRGLVIDGGPPTAPGLNGVRFINGAALHIQNCVIRNFTSTGANSGHGVLFTPSTSAKLIIRDTVISRNGVGAAGGGVVVKPASGAASVTLTRVTMDDNSNGFVADSTTASAIFASILDSSASANSNTGIALIGGVGANQSFVKLDRSAASNNSNGIGVTGANSNVLLSHSVVTGNNNGLVPGSGGKIVSFSSNMFNGNAIDGSPTSTVPAQ